MAFSEGFIRGLTLVNNMKQQQFQREALAAQEERLAAAEKRKQEEYDYEASRRPLREAREREIHFGEKRRLAKQNRLDELALENYGEDRSLAVDEKQANIASIKTRTAAKEQEIAAKELEIAAYKEQIEKEKFTEEEHQKNINALANFRRWHMSGGQTPIDKDAVARIYGVKNLKDVRLEEDENGQAWVRFITGERQGAAPGNSLARTPLDDAVEHAWKADIAYLRFAQQEALHGHSEMLENMMASHGGGGAGGGNDAGGARLGGHFGDTELGRIALLFKARGAGDIEAFQRAKLLIKDGPARLTYTTIYNEFADSPHGLPDFLRNGDKDKTPEQAMIPIEEYIFEDIAKRREREAQINFEKLSKDTSGRTIWKRKFDAWGRRTAVRYNQKGEFEEKILVNEHKD